jgi:hypothetical protein
VDTEGWLLALAVTAASASDKAGAKLAAACLLLLFTTLRIMWADSGYNGSPLAEWMKKTAGVAEPAPDSTGWRASADTLTTPAPAGN